MFLLILDSPAVVSIWGHPLFESPDWEARLQVLGHEVEDGGNVPVAIPEQKKEGAANAKYLKEITATCTKHGGNLY